MSNLKSKNIKHRAIISLRIAQNKLNPPFRRTRAYSLQWASEVIDFRFEI